MPVFSPSGCSFAEAGQYRSSLIANQARLHPNPFSSKLRTSPLRVGQLSNSTLTARKIAQCQRLVIGTHSYFNAAGVPRIPADLVRHQVITYEVPLGGATWPFQQGAAETLVSVA